jgi:DNA methylase
MGSSDEDKFDHPTQKPVELKRRPILNHTKIGELVYEPFLGSGITPGSRRTHRAGLLQPRARPEVCGWDRAPMGTTERQEGDTRGRRAELRRDRSGKENSRVNDAESLARPLPPLADRIARARREIAAIEAEIRAGNPDLHGLVRGLLDSSCELRQLENEQADAAAGL